MKSKEIFTIAVRLVGLIGVVYLGMSVYHVLTNFHGFRGFHWSVLLHLFLRFIFFLIALYFLRGAPALVRFAFDEENGAYNQHAHDASKPPTQFVN